MSCFTVNETTGRNVLEYADDFEYNAKIRIVHRYWNLLFTFMSIILNALLCVVITRFSNPMIKINSMLFCNSIIDLLFASFYFLFGRYSFIGYSRVFSFFTGFVQLTNPNLYRLMTFCVIAINVASMNVVIAQFIFRYLLVRFNEQPRGRRLYWFLSFCILLTGLHLLVIVGGNSAHLSAEDIEDSIAILRHYGYDVQPHEIVGRVLKPNRPVTLLQVLPLVFSLFGFILLIGFSVAIRRTLRQTAGMKITATRRLNQSMDRTIISMGLVPLISNVFPSLAYGAIMSRCQSNAIFSLILSTCIVSSPFLNSLVTLVFIRSYRQSFFRLITFGYFEKPRQNKTSIVITTLH
ncbi:hypothetical protein M3Y95_00827100 [Aphelenchoides besseyi]|nr:hypothetical protein M3Y95_00827100 [Aphelenchoides besseyi]